MKRSTRMRIKTLILLFAALMFATPILLKAEAQLPNRVRKPASPEALRLARFKAAARKLLVKKLTNKDGTPTKIYVLPPIDYTTSKAKTAVMNTITKNIKMYDPILSVKEGEFPLTGVTLEQFRKAIATNRADVIFVTVMYPTNFDMYLYDKRRPFQIYAHTEPISSVARYNLSNDAATYYTKLLIRRTLYRFIKNQYYELPRDNSSPILKSEIPRYIASKESLEKVNREMRTKFYVGTGIGAMMSLGGSGTWNSNLLGFQAAYNVADSFYLEGAVDLAAYNAFIGSVKYLFSNKQQSFKFTGGLGLATVMDKKTLNWDQTDGIKTGSVFAVPSFTFLYPIVDVYLKAETQVFIGLNNRNYIFTLLPGVVVLF